eukprot:1242937-Pleurochrysis_carterae.AAC.3
MDHDSAARSTVVKNCQHTSQSTVLTTARNHYLFVQAAISDIRITPKHCPNAMMRILTHPVLTADHRCKQAQATAQQQWYCAEP